MNLVLPVLPVSDVLEQLNIALKDHQRAVLSAPPGAGKTTLVPLYLLNQDWLGQNKIILLEPRRLAARAAAHRMASLCGEDVGMRVGYRMRLDNRVSPQTRIEVVTEGVFTRMILDDPELTGVGAVIFDEFHERSLDADFGLALALDVQSALREDLRILVMSATLDVERIAALMDHPPVIQSMGRSFPVDIQYQDRPAGERVEDTMTRVILEACHQQTGSILAFLPGQAEIARTAARLEPRLGSDTVIAPLYGNLPQRDQDAAIKPAPSGRRKIVLATSIAETSITIDGVRIVIDSGLQRLPVFEASTGITRLETVRVSKASADQRAGRAGRTEPGLAIRLWHHGQTAALPPFTPPQILSSDLSGFVLDLAHWGVQDTQTLALMDQPPRTTLNEARILLRQLGAIDSQGALTQRGKEMRNLGLPPRLAAMLIASAAHGHARDAAMLAVLLTEQGLGGASLDLEERLRRFKTDKSERAQSARKLAERLARQTAIVVPSNTPVTAGQLLLHAFPDRVALQRGGRGRFVMANGRGAQIPETEQLAHSTMLIIVDLTGKAAQARILAAADITRADIEATLPEAIITEDQVFFDSQSLQVRARRITRFGAIIWEETPLPRPSGEAVAQALAQGLRDIGLAKLPFSKEALQLRERIGFLHRVLGAPWPDVSDAALLERMENWFTPYQRDARSLADVSSGGLSQGLMALVPYEIQRDLARFAPTHFEAPTGQRHPIDYSSDEPVLTIRVQELFGLKQHPVISGGRWPLLLELTSPAHRPIQTTRDLPGFWTGSWKDVRAEMRGRYPRHPWPEQPENAAPTTRAKPKGS